jgi:Rho family protein
MLCFSVDSPQSLENVETKWKNEIEENCPGVKIVLVALKCDLRETQDEEEENPQEPKRPMIEYKQGLQVAQNIKALRYLGMQDATIASLHGSQLTHHRMFGNEKSWCERSIQ